MHGIINPSFIPSADIRKLRNFIKYQFNLICMITGKENRLRNYLTVSNLKLDDVFSDVFDKSCLSVTEQILQHHEEKFNVTPFIRHCCKTPIKEIPDAIDDTIFPK